MSQAQTRRRPFSTVEKVLIGLQALAVLGFWVFGMFDANDPGWGDLVRVVITMLAIIWVGGIVGSIAIARVIGSRTARAAVLLGVPFAGFIAIMLWSYFG